MHKLNGSDPDLIAVGADAEVVVGQDVGCGDVAIDVVVRGLFTSICIQLVTSALVNHVSTVSSHLNGPAPSVKRVEMRLRWERRSRERG